MAVVGDNSFYTVELVWRCNYGWIRQASFTIYDFSVGAIGKEVIMCEEI